MGPCLLCIAIIICWTNCVFKHHKSSMTFYGFVSPFSYIVSFTLKHTIRGQQCWARFFNDDSSTKRYHLGSQIFQYETKSVNLKNILFKSRDQDFWNLAWMIFLKLNNAWMIFLSIISFRRLLHEISYHSQ